MRPGLVAYLRLLEGGVGTRHLCRHCTDGIGILKEVLRCYDVFTTEGLGQKGSPLSLTTHRIELVSDDIEPPGKACLTDVDPELSLHRDKHITHSRTCFRALCVVLGEDFESCCCLLEGDSGTVCRCPRDLKGLGKVYDLRAPGS